VQRDHGNRKVRNQSRLKYTIDRLGLDRFLTLLHERLGYVLGKAKPYSFIKNGDRFGWKKGTDGKWSYTLFVEGGRVKNTDQFLLKTALREIAGFHDGNFILTGNQNLILANASSSVKRKIDTALNRYNVKNEGISGLRKNSIACVALNTCGLAFAEAERYLPFLIGKIEIILEQHGLLKDEIVIRMTGCPNGCGRPYLAEIGLIGKSPGRYNLYLGGNFIGSRLNTLFKEILSEDEILETLKPIIADYAQNRNNDERFGDFVIRHNYVKATLKGSDFKH
jgi:sulfite reductase (NADPH) hemoprotein beta-component